MKKTLFYLLLSMQAVFAGHHVADMEPATVNVKNFEEDVQKAEYIATLETWHDIIVDDIGYRGRVVIAVGEDNSRQTRIKYTQDEYHLGLTLYSLDGGKHWRKVLEGDIPLRRVIVLEKKKAIAIGSMEGAGGVVKMTEDAGEHWKTVYEGGFLNDITQHSNGFFVAGDGILYSKDGIKWYPALQGEDEFYAILSIGYNRLVAAGNGKILFSNDSGRSWRTATVSTDIAGVSITHIYRKNGNLYVRATYPDGFKLVSCDDGEHWTEE